MEQKNSNKILIGVIIGLALVIGVLVFILVRGNKDNKDVTETITTTEAITTEKPSTEAEVTTEAKQEEQSEKADCYVTVTNTNGWESNGGYSGQLDVKIVNNSGKELSDWMIEIEAPKDASIESGWNGDYNLKDNKLTIIPVEYNGTITTGGISDIGFIMNCKSEADLKSMTKNVKLYIAGSLYQGSGSSDKKDSEETTEEKTTEEPKKPAKKEEGTPVANHGALAVEGTDLVDVNGDKYQLKGVSTHGIAWFPEYVNKDGFQTFRDDWGANLIRLAMYTDEYGGYCNGGDKAQLKKLVNQGVEAATELGMYVIVDWHILHDLDPNKYKSDAKDFFEEMSKKYANYENVLYEICNEPNGGTSWESVKSYAEEIIPIIRKNDKDAIIIVGTPNWSQDVDVASENPVKGFDNIMYAVHFYAATHTDNIRSKVDKAIGNGLPVFISEFSICDASGNGAIDYNQADKWFELVAKYNLSYAAWNISNKDETSSLIKSSCSKTSGWSEDELSDTGKWLRNLIRNDD